jgi:hypothetical protein
VGRATAHSATFRAGRRAGILGRMRAAVAIPLVLTVLLASTAFFRTYADTEILAESIGAPFGVLLLALGVPALVRWLQRRGSSTASAEPFWTPAFAWVAFAIALVGALGAVSQRV